VAHVRVLWRTCSCVRVCPISMFVSLYRLLPTRGVQGVCFGGCAHAPVPGACMIVLFPLCSCLRARDALVRPRCLKTQLGRPASGRMCVCFGERAHASMFAQFQCLSPCTVFSQQAAGGCAHVSVPARLQFLFLYSYLCACDPRSLVPSFAGVS